MTAATSYPHSTSCTQLVPYSAEMISAAHEARSFQTREVLQAIVTGEQQRLREEQMVWRLGGAFIGACLGLGDGFQAADVFLGMGFSSLAGMGHDVMSQNDKRFLESCQSLWLLGDNSPTELMRRIGSPLARILFYCEGWQAPIVLSHHRGLRGDVLVPLQSAGEVAQGFLQPKSMEVMKRHFDSKDIQILRNQLYPDAGRSIHLQGIQRISSAEAHAVDPNANAFLPACEPVLIQINAQQGVAYQVPIPIHSDY